METRSELTYQEANYFGEDVIYFHCNSMEVDGIYSEAMTDHFQNVYKAPMFTMKEDFEPYEQSLETDEGFLRSTQVSWNGPYMPLSYKEGDVDEDIYVRFGLIMTPIDEDYEYYRGLIDQNKIV